MASYTPNTWTSGDVVSKTKLDRLENGAAAALAAADAPELIRDTIGATLVQGANVTITPNDAGDTIAIAAATSGASGIPATIVDAQGDLVGASAADVAVRVPAGTVDGQVLTRDAAATAGVSWSSSAAPPVHAVGNSGSALTIDASAAAGYVKTITLTANCTFTLTGAAAGRASTLELVLTQDATGSRTVTWPAAVKWEGSAPTLSTAAGSIDRVVLTSYNGGTTWLANLVGKGYT